MLNQLAIGVRAGQWWYFLALPAAALPAGLWRAQPARALASWAGGAAIAALCLGYAYAINGLSERGTDLDFHKNPWIGQDVLPGARAAVAGLAALALVAAAAAGWLALGASAVSVAAATLYSAGPRTKSRVALGTLSNGLIFGPLLLVAPGAVIDRGLVGWLGTFVALLLQNQLVHEQADAAEDAAAGDRSTAAWLGAGGTRLALAALGLAAAVAAAYAVNSSLAQGITWTAVVLASAVALSARPAPWRRRWQRWISFAGGALAYASIVGAA